ncbi:MAG: hypothetical protein H7844_07025 [Nitrospirae bacterium YQR-1]
MYKKFSFMVFLTMLLFLTTFYIPKAGSVDGTYVTYFLPYLHTGTNYPVYCVVTNNGIGADNVTQMGVFVMSNASGVLNREMPSTTLTGELSYKRTTMLTFSGRGLYMGTAHGSDYAIDLSPYVGTSEAYGVKLTFISTIKRGSNAKRDSHLNCKSLPMACFMGTTSPKRNVSGVICEAGYLGSTIQLYTNRPYNIAIEDFVPDEYWADNATNMSY